MVALLILAVVLFGAGAVVAARERGYALALVAAGLALYALAEILTGGGALAT